jgi:wyosine [tRNA(Phe)-imidazoG37] synthetase (radical SAM superfamily)
LRPKDGIIYGPVTSRRLGLSLGINILPPRRKLCTFDCAYCQYGWTERAPAPDAAFPSVAQVLAAVEESLRSLALRPAYLTFSGNGEPTAHPELRSIVAGVRALRDRLLPTARLAVLSNSTNVGPATVRDALGLLDVRIMKLDAGTEVVFQRYCRPLTSVTLDDIVGGLSDLRDVTVQTLFAGGPGGNAEPAHVGAWLDQVVALAPVDVQLYTLDRDWPSRELSPVEPDTLHAIAAALHKANCPATVYLRG